MHLEEFMEDVDRILCDDLEVLLNLDRGFLEVRTQGDHLHIFSMPLYVSELKRDEANRMIITIAEIQAKADWVDYRKKKRRKKSKKAAGRKKDQPEKCSIERGEA